MLFAAWACYFGLNGLMAKYDIDFVFGGRRYITITTHEAA